MHEAYWFLASGPGTREISEVCTMMELLMPEFFSLVKYHNIDNNILPHGVALKMNSVNVLDE